MKGQNEIVALITVLGLEMHKKWCIGLQKCTARQKQPLFTTLSSF